MPSKKTKKTKNYALSAKNRPERSVQPEKNQTPVLPQAVLKARADLLLYGHHPVVAALANPQRENIHLFATEDAFKQLQNAGQMSDLLPMTLLNRPQLDQLTKSKHAESGTTPHQGLVLQTRPLTQPDITDILSGLDSDNTAKRFLILDQVTDPRNVGAIVRSAQAFGTEAIIVTHRHAPDETGALAKAAAGALENVPIVRVTNLARTLEALRDRFVTLVGLDAKADTTIDQLAHTPHLGLVIGSEGDGLRRLTREACDVMAAIEMAQTSESLNVSVATAIALYATQFSNKNKKPFASDAQVW